VKTWQLPDCIAFKKMELQDATTYKMDGKIWSIPVAEERTDTYMMA
jgi:hypothetical protein